MTGSSAAVHLGAPGNDVDHLPYGAYTLNDQSPRLGVRLGEHVLEVNASLELAGGVGDAAREAAAGSSLDGMLAADKSVWDEVRSALQTVLRDPAQGESIAAIATPVAEVTMAMPFTVADYVDFYGNEHHASNVGRIFRPSGAPLTPNWKHIPIGYHGRAGTIVPSGTDVRRPNGIRLEPDDVPRFGPSARLDIEAEVGFVLGAPVPDGVVALADAEEHIFGMTILNDWSARDIQSFEYVPLGPNLGKSFCSTISPWVTPLTALAAARVAPPPRDTPLAPYLDDHNIAPWGFDLRIEIVLNGETVSTAPFSETYWTAAQMLAHMTINGAGLRAGDFFGAGTVSGTRRDQRGSFLEIAWNGGEPLRLADGSAFSFLRDGDEVVMRATAPGTGGSEIALGECAGRVVSAKI